MNFKKIQLGIILLFSISINLSAQTLRSDIEKKI